MKSTLGLDIETFPISEESDDLLEYKLRNCAASDYAMMKQKYQFLNPMYAKVIAIGTVYIKDESSVPIERVFTGDEPTLLSDFSNYLSKFSGIYVHFNGLDFDVPFSLCRMAVNGIQPPNARFCNLTRFRTDPHYDVMQVLCFWRSFGISLKEACRAFNIPDPKDILQGKPVTEFLKSASLEELKEYVLGDARAAVAVFQKLYPILS